MTVMEQLTPRQGFMYWGARGEWLVAFTVHRDSDVIERSNWDVLTTYMTTKYPDDVYIERASHWAVGWMDHLLVRPGSPAVDAMVPFIERLKDYPVLDDEHLSMLEADEEWCVRCDRGMAKEHPLVGCGRFRSESDADDIRWRWQDRRNR
jgi:hypothetical protein